MKKLLVMLGVVALMASACGGGSDGGTTPTGNTAAQSAKSMQANYSLNGLATSVAFEAAAAAQPGYVHVSKGSKMYNFLKSGEFESSDVTCSAVGETGATCTISDGLGGSCTVTVSFNDMSDTMADMSMDMSCANYKPDSSTTLDGDMGFTAILNMDNLPASAMSAHVSKAVTKEDSSSCTITDDSETFENDYCALSDDPCAAANALFSFTFDIGDNGFTVIDECGTYTYGSDFTMGTNMCMDMPSETVITMIVALDVSGTFNGDAVDFSDSVTCTIDTSTMY